MYENKSIEITSACASSVVAFGEAYENIVLEQDEDEFFILAFTYADISYKVKAFARVKEEYPAYSLYIDIPENPSLKISKQYADALSVITGAAFLFDRREESVRVCVSYIRDGKSFLGENVYTKAIANLRLEKLMRKIHRLLYLEDKLSSEAISTLKNLKFPYPSLREGQEIFIKRSLSTIKKQGRLFVEAPTGIGKTVSALYSGMRGIGEGFCDKIFYLTAKGSTANEAFKACGKLFSVGAKLRCAVLSAKQRICPRKSLNGGECEGYECPLMKRYYSKSEDAIYELISSKYGYSTEDICECAAKFGICPYELSLDLSEMCGVVICDYNYVFDTRVRIKRYFDGDSPKKKYLFLIDEAHNLVSRAKEMYSSTLKMSETVKLFKLFPNVATEAGSEDIYGGIKSDIRDFAKSLSKISNLCRESIMTDATGIKRGFYISSEPIQALVSPLALIEKKLSAFCEDFKASEYAKYAEDYLKNLSHFKTAIEEDREGMRYYIEIEDKEIIFKAMCVDPSSLLGERLSFSSSAIFFSATFSPTEYYMQTLSRDKLPKLLTLNSPFPKENRFCAVYTGITTRYEKRDTEKTLKRALSVIAAVVSAKKGNYMLCFPSYSYMMSVYERFSAKYPKVRTAVQGREMSYRQRNKFIEFFEDDTSIMRVGFCVLGGSFSEGIDLPGNRLIGSVIFGVGLPGISNEQNIIKEYYDFKDGNGYDFAYTYPGFNNVLQAAGRVIRSENDKGVIIFADERYAEEKYKFMMPERFSGMNQYQDLETLMPNIEEFWRKS